MILFFHTTNIVIKLDSTKCFNTFNNKKILLLSQAIGFNLIKLLTNYITEQELSTYFFPYCLMPKQGREDYQDLI